jgi:hypothetical protein
MPQPTDLVTDLPADFEVFGQAVATSLADLLGGTSGQVLAKNSNTDMDFVWVAQDDSNAIQNSIVDAKGDLIAASANDTPARLAVGTNGQVLTADSTAGTGLAWATPAVTNPNLVLIASGTLSGASVTFSSLSNYDELILIAYGMTNSTGNGYPVVRVNNNSTTNYDVFSMYQNTAAFTEYTGIGADVYYLNTGLSLRTSNANIVDFKFTNCKSTGFTNISGFSTVVNSASVRTTEISSGIYGVSEAVSSLVFYQTGGNWAGGSYRLYGA